MTRDVSKLRGGPRLLHAVVQRGRQGDRRRHGHPAGRATSSSGPPPTRRYRWFELNAAGLDVEIEDVSEEIAGRRAPGSPLARCPRGRDAAPTGRTSGTSATAGPRSAASTCTSRAPATRATSATRSGCRPDAAVDVWDALWEAGEPHGIRPAGIRALDVARVEAGLILVEADYTSARHAISPEQTTPRSRSALGRARRLRQARLRRPARARARARPGGPARRLVGLDLDWTGIEALFAKHDLPPMVSALVHRDPVPVYKDGRAGRPRDERDVGTDDQEDGRRSARSRPRWPRPGPGCPSSGASRASAARSRRPSSSCPSSTSTASARNETHGRPREVRDNRLG